MKWTEWEKNLFQHYDNTVLQAFDSYESLFVKYKQYFFQHNRMHGFRVRTHPFSAIWAKTGAATKF